MRHDRIEQSEAAQATAEKPWWHSATIYEIALISFQDSNGDGKGDLAGLLSRVDYLKWLGVDAVWLTPIYRSPFRDLGYDISDYCSIDSAFGTLDDFDLLLGRLHDAGIRLILDLVPNHTANDHAWFVESRSSRDNAKADWYIWADPAENGGPPNNWLSRFGGSAWEWCEARRQYYYHSFLVEQPDLNWRNPEVRAAIADVMRFWLDRGVDGFRVDASAVLIKDHLLRDNPPNPDAEGEPPPQRQTPVFTDDRPETMQCIEDIRNVIDEYRGRLLCGEVQGKTDRIGHFYGNDRPRLHLPLNFALLDTRWNALSLQAAIDAYFNALPSQAWPVWVIGGHDKPRVTSRIGEAQMRILAMLLMTLRGTPFFYMGDEIGGERVSIPPIGSAIRSRSWCRAMGFAGIPSARRCAGMTARMAASPMDTLGCRPVQAVQGMSPTSNETIARSLPCFESSSRCGASKRVYAMASSSRSAHGTMSSPSNAP